MQDKLCFVQFLHPGGEHGPDAPGVKAWTRGQHARKFLRLSGRALVSGQARQGILGFWGEWEAQSKVEPLIQPHPDGPRWIHRPYWSPPTSYRDVQNTDPFVYGDCFHYTGCLQHTKHGPTQLRNLSRGSVVLFGSCRHANFVVDTVFVVSSWIDHSMRDYTRKLGNVVSETYSAVTLAPWYGNMRERDRVHRLYFGATVDNTVEGMFSFFPCLPIDGVSRAFVRPSISMPGVLTPTMTQNKRLNPRENIGEIIPLWDEVVRQVTNQGLMLGIHADLPPKIDSSLASEGALQLS